MRDINNQIKESHEAAKKRGDWGHPDIEKCTYHRRTGSDSMGAYIAEKLDLITEAIVDAMRARREGNIQVGEITKEGIDLGLCSPLETEGYHLALAYTRTLDLMGFYGVEHPDDTYAAERWCTEFYWEHYNDASMLASSCVWHLQEYKMRLQTVKNFITTGSPIVSSILRIAELDNIDLDWHYEALAKYMESEVK